MKTISIPKAIAALLLLATMMVLNQCATLQSAPADVPIKLKFTCPGNNDTAGTCAGYQMRWALDSASLEDHWDLCPVVDAHFNAPMPYGYLDSVTFDFRADMGTYYYFRMMAVDSAGNWSQVSNAAWRFFRDTIPPCPPGNLH